MHCVYFLLFINISKDFAINNMKKTTTTGLRGVANFFSVDFNPIDNNDILGIRDIK